MEGFCIKGKLIVTLQFLLLGAMVLVPNSGQCGTAFKLGAAGLVILGGWLVMKSFKDLGDSLTALPESKEGALLITQGIYSKIRHPIYSGLFLISSGFLLYKQSLESLVVFLALNLLLLYKANYEDRLLRAKFPEASAYQSTIPAFFPSLRKGK